jgi:glycosyltransferase A (GT-A) superfamily protein (DUF2064 family)
MERAEAIKVAGETRAADLRRTVAAYEEALRQAARNRTEELHRVVLVHDQAMASADADYQESLQESIVSQPPAGPWPATSTTGQEEDVPAPRKATSDASSPPRTEKKRN